jgi:hypothetical protein
MSRPDKELLAGKLSRVANRLKGLLILLVVLDHNDWFRQLAPQVFGPLTFHVIGFFFLAFSFSEKPLTLDFIASRTVRYLVPFWWALTLTSMATSVILKSDISVLWAIENFLASALVGSASLVKTSSGLYMLWFLPCLFGLTCLLAGADTWTRKHGIKTVYGLALAGHLALPYIKGVWMAWVPFGLLVAAYVFFLGLVWRQCLRFRWTAFVGPLALACFMVCYGFLVENKVHIELGTLELSALQNPGTWVLHLLSVFSALLVLVWLADGFKPMGWIERIGEKSMLVYLIHPLSYLVLTKLWVSPGQAESSSGMLLFHACATSALAVSSAYGLSLILSRSEVFSSWVTPSTWRQWPPMGYLRQLGRV